jgi:hypothetical protein
MAVTTGTLVTTSTAAVATPANGTIRAATENGRHTDQPRGNEQSTDGGRHWSGPTVVATGGPNVQSYNHSVEVTEDSAVVLTYYDDATTSPGDGVATTDVWLRHSHSGGATWEPEQHLHGPFDHYDAPISFFAPGDPRGCSSATTWASKRSQATT